MPDLMTNRGLSFVQMPSLTGERVVIHDRGPPVHSDRVSRLLRLEMNSIEIIRFPRTSEIAYSGLPRGMHFDECMDSITRLSEEPV
jgi:hypothetical protein